MFECGPPVKGCLIGATKCDFHKTRTSKYILLHDPFFCVFGFNLFSGVFCGTADGDVPYRPTAEAADAGQVEEDEDDDAIAARRARIRERLRARPAEEAEVLEVEHEEIAK